MSTKKPAKISAKSPAKNGGESIGQMEPLIISDVSKKKAALIDLAMELASKSSGFRRSLPLGLASQQDVGPTALKTCAGVVQWSIEQLDALGVISLNKMEQEQLPVLRIEVMTPEEEEALRRGDHLKGEQPKAA
ncbi:MAG: hypothetical protein AB7H70_04580 [Rhodospirillaceae bacterium]